MNSTLRYDEVTDRWVIVAPARRGTPLDVVHRTEVTGDASTCPFCPGHEDRTTETVSSRTDASGRWTVRAFRNRFPMVTEDVPPAETPPPERTLAAHGRHEVIVETPDHDRDLADVPDALARDVVDMYRERLRALARTDGARAAVLFKNRGPRAGGSLLHAHAQVLALPIATPEQIHRAEVARRHYAEGGRAVLETVRDRELAARVRVVEETPGFVAFCPFASHRAYETWIVPRVRRASLADVPDEDLAPLGALLVRTLRRFLRATNGADYNLVLRVPAFEDAREPWAAWHLEVLPRHVREAGFELSTGMHGTHALPEESAAAMRAAGA